MSTLPHMNTDAFTVLSDQANTLPPGMTNLVACRVCGLIKQDEQFETFGCQNCTTIEPVIWNTGSAAEMTTKNFSGCISMLKPTESWVAKWQLMKKNYVPGLYAIYVSDRLTAKEALEQESGTI